jgi:hypothetical protein
VELVVGTPVTLTEDLRSVGHPSCKSLGVSSDWIGSGSTSDGGLGEIEVEAWFSSEGRVSTKLGENPEDP